MGSMTHPPDAATTPPAAPKRRPQPGERRAQILQALAAMLERPGAERITTAALAARLGVSEAALYRHFASKAQMFDALLDFIEETLLTRMNQIVAAQDELPASKVARTAALLLQFCERNPGLARVLAGDALLLEHDRLQERVDRMFDRIESQLRQCLREAAQQGGSAAPTADAQVAASTLIAFCQGRLQRFVRSEFRRLPTEQLDACMTRML
ncbi:MAG: nucleoid occlusion factor SlmA [Giesbergeria sp.]